MADLQEGDLCFAHVRSFPWWPARISRKTSKKSRVVYSVIFFGTEETANLPGLEVVSVSDESIRKYVTKGSLKRKLFKEGLDELLKIRKEHTEVVVDEEKNDEPESNLAEVVVNESKLGFLSIFGLQARDIELDCSNEVPKDPTIIDGENKDPNATIDEFDDEFGDVFGPPVKLFSASCSVAEKCDKNHDSDTDDSDDNDVFIDKNARKVVDDKPVVVNNTGPSSGKKSVKKVLTKKTGNSKLVRSLQEDEVEANKLFAENIEEKEDYFFCKVCSKFSCTTKMRAKSHAVSCGKTKKKGRPTKVCKCLYCDKVFSSRKDLIYHNRIHSSLEYTCSTCLDTFTRHNSYLRHIRSHNESKSWKCESCAKEFRYKFNLKRHMKVHSKGSAAVFKPLAKIQEESEDVYEIDLEEIRSNGEYFGKLTITELDPSRCYKRGYTSFESSLGVGNVDAWNEFVDASNRSGVPLSTFGGSSSAESCVYTDRSGRLTVQFAWSSFQSSEEIVHDILIGIVDDAVVLASLEDPEVDGKELLEIVDDVLVQLLNKYYPIDIIAKELEFKGVEEHKTVEENDDISEQDGEVVENESGDKRVVVEADKRDSDGAGVKGDKAMKKSGRIYYFL